jgi:DNA polymerase-1
MIDRYFERFPGINRYIAETLSSVREKGFTASRRPARPQREMP